MQSVTGLCRLYATTLKKSKKGSELGLNSLGTQPDTATVKVAQTTGGATT